MMNMSSCVRKHNSKAQLFVNLQNKIKQVAFTYLFVLNLKIETPVLIFVFKDPLHLLFSILYFNGKYSHFVSKHTIKLFNRFLIIRIVYLSKLKFLNFVNICEHLSGTALSVTMHMIKQLVSLFQNYIYLYQIIIEINQGKYIIVYDLSLLELSVEIGILEY